MGSWSGHTLPGSFFIFFGLIWAIKVPYRFFCPKPLKKTKGRRCWHIKWDIVEAGFKIFTASFGLLIEQLLPWEPWFHIINPETKDFHNANNWSHSTMYAFFLLSGIVDICVLKKPKITPHCLHHLAMALAFGTEGYLFYFHTHGREELDVRLHVLLLFAVWPSSLVLVLLAILDKNENAAAGYAIIPQKPQNPTLATFKHTSDQVSLLQPEDELNDVGTSSPANGLDNGRLQMKTGEGDEWTEMNKLTRSQAHVEVNEEMSSERKKIFTLQLVLATLTILQGTWFWQVAYVLYPPNGKPWEEDSHKNIAFITMFFTWHLILAITVVTACYCAVGFLARKRKVQAGIRNYSALQTSELP